jgi:hypothetical protein
MKITVMGPALAPTDAVMIEAEDTNALLEALGLPYSTHMRCLGISHMRCLGISVRKYPGCGLHPCCANVWVG